MPIINEEKNESKIIRLLFKDFSTSYNSRSISKIIGISHVAAFKIMKKLEKREIVKAERIGNALIYTLNASNPLTNRLVETSLTLEAQGYRRWLEDFSEIQNMSDLGKVYFAILFGSITKNEEKARDIDLLIVSGKKYFEEIKKYITERNKIFSKRVHLILQSREDFERDISNKNKAMLEIIKKGIVLYGQIELRKILGKILEK